MGRGRFCSPCNTPQSDAYQLDGGSCNSSANFNPNDFQRGGSCATRGDGVVIRPEANAFASPEQYDAAVKGACKYTDQNYDQALKDAAAKGQPVVAIFGSRNTPDTQKLLATVQAAQKNGADGATYVYIDMDRLAQNPNSGLAKFVDQNVRGHNLAHTMLFTQRPDAAGNPVPESAMMTAWGGRDQIQGLLRDHVKYGQDSMRGRQFNIKPSDAVAPEAAVTDQAQPGARKNQDLLKDIQSGLEDGKKATDWREGEKHYLKALRAADQIDQTAVKADMAKTQEAIKAAEAKGDVKQAGELQKQMDQLQTMQDAPWKSRMEFGFNCMKWNPNYKDVGEQWLMSAGDRNPNMYMTPEFRARLREAGYTAQTENAFAKRVAQHELNKIGPVGPNQQRDVGPDGKPRQNPADRVNPPLQTDRQKFPDDRPPINPDLRPPLRPQIKPEVRPQVRPDVQPAIRPEVKPPVRPEERPEQRVAHPEIPNLLRAGHGMTADAAEHNALVKAADEGLTLKAAWGATWCPKCPAQLASFERNAQGRKDAVYFTNHDFDSSSLANQTRMNRDSAPQFHSYTVQRVSENEFKVTPVGSRNAYTVRTNVRRKAS
ncbi:MAG: hypothetical protein IT342_20870 [Candidatus Melainabacteria bacterium]|nr:hypothetical protein [Candidatus Melainabacteria bacterium]